MKQVLLQFPHFLLMRCISIYLHMEMSPNLISVIWLSKQTTNGWDVTG